MCVAMVIIHTKTLEKKSVDDVTVTQSNFELVRLGLSARFPDVFVMTQ